MFNLFRYDQSFQNFGRVFHSHEESQSTAFQKPVAKCYQECYTLATCYKVILTGQNALHNSYIPM